MSTEFAALVASKMGPGEVDDLLSEAMRVLQERYAAARLHSVSLTFSWCERDDGGPSERSLSWSLQVDNEHGYGESRSEALRELRERLEGVPIVADYAERVAALLRELPPKGRLREHVLQSANCILDNDRRHGR